MKIKLMLDTIEKVKKFVRVCDGLSEDMVIKSGRYIADPRSIMALFGLDLSKPITLEVSEDSEKIKDIMKEWTEE